MGSSQLKALRSPSPQGIQWDPADPIKAGEAMERNPELFLPSALRSTRKHLNSISQLGESHGEPAKFPTNFCFAI